MYSAWRLALRHQERHEDRDEEDDDDDGVEKDDKEEEQEFQVGRTVQEVLPKTDSEGAGESTTCSMASALLAKDQALVMPDDDGVEVKKVHLRLVDIFQQFARVQAYPGAIHANLGLPTLVQVLDISSQRGA